VQEGAALAQLLNIFPASTVHEVGLCCVSPDNPAMASCPALPLLAASPDALIAHHLLLQPEEAELLRGVLAGMAAASKGAEMAAGAAEATVAMAGVAAMPGAAVEQPPPPPPLSSPPSQQPAASAAAGNILAAILEGCLPAVLICKTC
ncbi:hypothetical protein Vretifemale_12380, partial [Volvox reticuliferus]